MTDKKMTPQSIAYCGKRRTLKGKLLDAFALVNDSTDEDDLLMYKAARRCSYVIGAIYTANIDSDGRCDFSSIEIEDETMCADLICAWSTSDATARRAQENESVREKMQTQNRHKWLEALEPLRRQYRNMTIPQRRATKQLLIEWLEA